MTHRSQPHTNLCRFTSLSASRIWLAFSLAIFSLILLCFLLTPAVSPHGAQAQGVTATSLPLPTLPSWLSNDADGSQSIAWGDVDNDGDLDLAVGNSGGDASGAANKLYRNEGGLLQPDASWVSQDNDITFSLAWGDMNGDGYLDLAAGNWGHNKVYLNQGGKLQTTAIWTAVPEDDTESVAWGDVDGDSDLDLAVGNGFLGDNSFDKVYLNNGGLLEVTPSWISADEDDTHSVAWGDMDGDKDLDLAVGNDGVNKVYLNVDKRLQITATWISSDTDDTQSLAWGDMNRDGYLDLAVGNYSAPNKVYLNDRGLLQRTASWISNDPDVNAVFGVAWGDVDGDGDLDLAASDKVYLNEGIVLQTTAAWVAEGGETGTSVAWGDMDGDGDLDLAMSNSGTDDTGKPTEVYINNNGLLQITADNVRRFGHGDATLSVAWGDTDGDGDLDLAAGTRGSDKVYVNENGILQTVIWTSTETLTTYSIAWGDVDSDGDLDLAAGNIDGPNKIYLNDGKNLQPTAGWSSEENDRTTSLAWGDLDNDGDIDLAVGNEDGPSRLYLNQGDRLQTRAALSFGEQDDAESLAWGDIDNDGDLDLVVGNANRYDNSCECEVGGEDKLYLNQRGVLQAIPVWVSSPNDGSAIALGDVDNDGDLDLAVGAWGLNRIFLNSEGKFSDQAGWISADADLTQSLAWGDIDGDSDLDLIAGNSDGANKIYLNQKGSLNSRASWVSTDDILDDETYGIALGDIDGDGDLDLAASNDLIQGVSQVYLNLRPAHPGHPGQAAAISLGLYSDPTATTNGTTKALAPANFYANPGIRQSGLIPITYTLFHPASQPMRTLRGYYSLDGGGQWYTASGQILNSITGNPLATAPYPTRTFTNTHTFLWNVFANGIFGQSDNVSFRIEAMPDYRPTPNSVAGPFQRPFVATQTYPFRVRGTQVQVYSGTVGRGVVAPNALVYWLPKEKIRDALPFADRTTKPFRTDAQGFLQGQGQLERGDRLVALLPIHATDLYTVYYTSATPVLAGMQAYTVTNFGLQQLEVSASHPLILFNLTASLEWDARKDTKFLNDLQFDLQRTSEFLYDWTNGQAALGLVKVYHEKQHWLDADIRVHATNRLRPHATIGGSVPSLTLEVITKTLATGVMTVTRHLYRPGQVEMGAVWNRYGEAGDTQSQDWPRTLAHELGHYLFFLHDNYIGLDGNRIIRVEQCPGVMSDPYIDINSEFHPTANWLQDCGQTFSQQQVGRSDWETMRAFYSWLQPPTTPIDYPPDAGPNLLPLAVTQIQFAAIVTPSDNIDLPSFSLTTAKGERYRASNRARAFLLRQDHLLDLGAPSRDRVQAWDAGPNDTLCIYDLAASPNPLTGCQTILNSGQEFELSEQPAWRPDVIIVPSSSHSITVHVNGIASNLALRARLYPSVLSSSGSALSEIALLPDPAGGYSGVITLPQPTIDAYLHVYEADNPTRGIVAEYTLGGAPALVLSEGDALVLSEGDVLKKDDGSTLVLSEGDVVALSDGNVVIRKLDGSVLVLSEGDALVLSEGDIVVHNGVALVLSEGDTLAVGDGNISIRRLTGEIIPLQHGDTLQTSQGSALVLSEGDVSIWRANNNEIVGLGNGDALLLSEGDTLFLNSGEALALSEGDALIFSEGDAQLIGSGDALVLSEGDAPVRSSDGQVTLYAGDLDFKQGEFYTLQPATQIPAEPDWATIVGQAYRITASPSAPNLTNASISFNYIGRDVEDDKEHLLKVYFWSGIQWEELPTIVDDYHNTATASARGVGIYVLMYSIDLQLSGQGWDAIGYPVQGSRPIQKALSSIGPYYKIVYYYDAFEVAPFQQWKVYGQPPVPTWINTLTELRFGQSYWISATHMTSVTLKLKDATIDEIQPAATINRGQVLPATYYGEIDPAVGFTPTAGMTVHAKIGGIVCGVGRTEAVEGHVEYSVIVYPDGPGMVAGCGATGRLIQLEIDGKPIPGSLSWAVGQVEQQNLPVVGRSVGEPALYLPIVRR